MRRREFMSLLGGAAAAWPLATRAQQPNRGRRVGVLMALPPNDSEGQERVAAFVQGLQQLGWTIGQNIRISYRWAGGDSHDMPRYAEELVASNPDVILAHSSAAVAPLMQLTRTIPIVFTLVADPVDAGYVNSLAHPGGNATGFTNFEYAMAGKWLELLKEVAPGVVRILVLRDPAIVAGPAQFNAIQSVAPPLGVELHPADVREADEIERAITAFARSPNGGLIVTGSAAALVHRDLIVALAARCRLPAVFNGRPFVIVGGLLCYGPDYVNEFRRAAGYVDRIFKGEKPGDLPVQSPTKYELVINSKTANALGLTIPSSLLAIADEVIE
jgi:putative tryptophan/tyrosine transport system substrate-binding protein